jgi:hypothetical protein
LIPSIPVKVTYAANKANEVNAAEAIETFSCCCRSISY